MGQQGWTPVPSSAGWTPVDGGDGWTPVERPPDFRTSNEKDAQGHPVLAALSTFLENAWDNMNPLPAAAAVGRTVMSVGKATGGIPAGRPDLTREGLDELRATARGILDAQNVVKARADAAWAKGDRTGALVQYAEWLLPLIGPAMSDAGTDMQEGRWAQGLGKATGIGLATVGEPVRTGLNVGTKVAGAGVRLANRARVPETANPELAEAVKLARERDIPLDAATVTGSPYVKSLQEAFGATPVGAVVDHVESGRRTAALRRVAGDLVDETHPQAVTPESAGADVRAAATDIEARRAGAFQRTGEKLQQAVAPGASVSPEAAGEVVRAEQRGQIAERAKHADEAYSLVRDIEQDSPESIQTAPRGSSAEARIRARLAAQAVPDQVNEIGEPVSWKPGKPPSEAELVTMRQIESELEAMPYNEGGLVPNKFRTEEEIAAGEQPYVQPRGGAPVYQDIVANLPGTSDPTRAEVLAGLQKTLEEGEWTPAGRAALKVAQERLRANGSLALPALPEGRPLLGAVRTVNAPVDLRPFKSAMKPIYQQLLREKELTGTLMGDRGRMLVALDQLMRAPEFESLSVVDQVLGDIKGFARQASIPELRTQGQGIAAKAVEALEAQVRAKAEQIGAMPALSEGRTATIQKHQAGAAFEDLRDGGVNAYRQMVAPGDTAIDQLRDVVRRTPAVVPKVARAVVDGLLADATVDGVFSLERAAAAAKKWEALGPQTKSLLFTPGTARRLEDFFRLSRRAGQRPFLKVPDGDVSAFQAMVGARDTKVASLRALQQVAPDAVPKIARAYLEGLFERATADGGFSRVAGLRADWARLGPATKRLLFPKVGQVEALDRFLLLADRLQSPFNTSKSAIVGITGTSSWALLHPVTGVPAVVGAGALAKLLQSPAGIRALTRGLQLSKPGLVVAPGTRMAAAAQLWRAAREAGVGVPALGTADRGTQQDR